MNGKNGVSAVLLLTALSLSAGAAQLDIVKDGKPCAVIVKGRRTKSSELAVEVLRHGIEKCTGAKLDVIRPKELGQVPPEMNRIFVGDCDYAKSKGLDSQNLKLEEYFVKASGRDLFLMGHDKEAPEWRTTGAPGSPHKTMDSRQYSPATLWAVTELLDRQAGVRFLWPGEGGAYYPKQKNLAVKEGYELRSRPFYERRQLWFGGGTWPPILEETNRYMMIHQQGSRVNTWFIDNFKDWWEEFGKLKPEVIALSPEEKRTYFVKPEYVKVCISNPEAVKTVVDKWRRAGRPDVWSMCPNDGRGFCVCPECRKLDSEEARKASAEDVWNGRVILTDRYVDFWNRVLKELKKENPKVQICVFGYGPYKRFPKGKTLEPGVLAAIVPGDFDVRGKGMEEWNSWARSGAKLFIRPNWLNTFWFSPYFPLKEVAEYIHVTDKSCRGYEHDTMGGCWASQGVYYYMLARLSYRKDLTVDDIKKEYASAFGKGAPEILKWIQYWEDYTDKLRGGVAEEEVNGTNGLYEKICKEHKYIRPHILYGCWDALPYVYTKEVLAPAYKLLDEADEKIGHGDPEALARVKFLRDGQDHIVKMNECMTLYWKAPLGRSPEFLKSFEELFRYRKKLEKNYVVQVHQLMYNEFARRIRIVPRNSDSSIQLEDVYVKEWMNKKVDGD